MPAQPSETSLATAIRFERVTKRFRLDHERPRSFQEAFVGAFRRDTSPVETLTALDEVSFELPHGDTLALVGPNGTGKSTILKLVARILEPNSGRVLVDGRVAALLELGTGFHPDLTGRENVFLNGSLMGLSRQEMAGRLPRIADFAELGSFLDVPVKHYSSGMYMRLGFATAIHVDADILLIDEVLAVGDQAFQNKCRERIAALRKGGMTILFVSHSAQAVRELCNRALWLEKGEILAYGDTEEVLEAYHRSVVEHEEARYAAEHARGTASEGAAEAIEEDPDRYGSGEVEILGVELLDAQGRPHHILRTGEPATVRLRYLAHERVERPVFGLAIHRDDGLHVTGPNTRDAGLDIPAVEGPGRVEWRIERLALMEGRYELSAACYDETLSHPYDHHHRRFPLNIRGGAGEAFGLVRLPATWAYEPGGGEPALGVGSPSGQAEGEGPARPAAEPEPPGPGA